MQACKQQRDVHAAKESGNMHGKRLEKGERKYRKEKDFTAGFSWLSYGPIAANVLQVRRKAINSSNS